jgi:hypothetical protein
VKRLLIVVLAALPLLASQAPARQQDGIVTQRLSSNQVSAEFSYRERGGVISDAHLKIGRAGRMLVDSDLTRADCPNCPTWRPAGRFVLRSLDADAEPELVLDFFSGGAYCCTYSLVFRYDAASDAYVRQRWSWGTAGYRFVNVDGTGPPELLSADHRFDSAFGPHAVSLEPLQIWRYDAGRLRDVTRRFPGRIKADARSHWKLYLKVRKSELREVRGILPAWLADQIMVGRAQAGWKALEAAYQRGELGRGRMKDGYPAGRRYLAALRTFLRRTGYLG